MLNAGTVQSFATLNDKGFESGINNLKKKGERFSKDMQQSFDRIGRSLTSIGSKMTATISAPLLGAGALAVKTASDYETLRTSMDILNGSVAEGARNFERLKEFSAQTPFQLGDLAKAQNMLQGFGLEADEAFKSIKMIGDIAAVSGGSIEGIGVAFGQAAAEGKLMTRDIRQLINQGVPAIKLLADTMGVAESEVFSLAEQGQISFDILNKAFQQATSEGGMFADGMKKQAQTIGGVFSTLKDNVSLALGELGQTIVEELDLKNVIKDLISNIQVGVKWFSSLSSEAKRFAIIGAGIAIAIGPTLFAIGSLSSLASVAGTALAALAGPIGLTIGALGALAAAITYLWDNWDAVKERISDWGWWRNTLISMAQAVVEWTGPSLMIKGWNAVIRYISDTTWFKDVLIDMVKSVAGVFDWLDIFDEAIASLDKLKGAASDIKVPQIPNPYEGIAESLEGLKVSTKEYEHQFGSFKDAVLNAVSELTGIDFSNLFSGGEDDDLATRRIKEYGQGIEYAKKVGDSLIPTTQQTIEWMRKQGVQFTRTATQSMAMANAMDIARDIANQFTDSFGQGLSNVIVQGKKLEDVLENIGKLLLSTVIQKGISILLTGGLKGDGFFGKDGGLFGALFGGQKHTGGLVPGSGDKMIRAKGGEMVLTKAQQKALNMGGGQTMMLNPNAIGQAIGRELDKRIRGVSDRKIFEMAEQGRYR